jgi:hypothetical protein
MKQQGTSRLAENFAAVTRHAPRDTPKYSARAGESYWRVIGVIADYDSDAASLGRSRYTQEMERPERRLRLVQASCILFIVLCLLLLHFGALGSLEPAGREIKLVQFLMIVGAIWSAIVGFTFQRKVNRTATRPRRPSAKSTPLSRWMVGHFMRLASGTSVGMWGLALYYFRASLWLVNTTLGAGLALLLIWKPGASPDIAIAKNSSAGS